MATTWRDRLLKGSWRGVPFSVPEHDADGLGRQTQVHVYPGKDEVFVEDISGSPNVFSLPLVVCSPDYFADRDKLLEALRKPGPGELIHPSLGRKVCVATDASMSEDFVDGGNVARFEVEFTTTSEPLYPAASAQTGAATASAAAAAKAAAADSFKGRMKSWFGQLTNYAQTASGVLAGGGLSSLTLIAGQYFPVGAAIGSVAALSGLAVRAENLAANPSGWADSLTSMFGAFGGLANAFTASAQADAATRPGGSAAAARAQARAGFRAAAATSNAGLTAVLASTYRTPDDPANVVRKTIKAGQAISIPDLRIQIAPGQSAIANDARLAAVAAEIDALRRRLALAEEAAASAGYAFDSYQEATDYRDSLCSRLQAEAYISEDGVAAALLGLRDAVSADLSTRAIDLRRLSVYAPTTMLPAVVIAYALYGDASQDADIVRRNGIMHPLFVPGGEPLEVLSV